MVSIEELRHQIFDVEGFNVRITAEYPDGSTALVEDYPYVRAANHEWTVAEWRTKRFTANFDGLHVDVLDADGSVVHGRTELDTIRTRTPHTAGPGPLVQPAATTPTGTGAGAGFAPPTITAPRMVVPPAGPARRRVPRWAKIVVPVAALAGLGALLPKQHNSSAEAGGVGRIANGSSTTIGSSGIAAGVASTVPAAAGSTSTPDLVTTLPTSVPSTTLASTTVAPSMVPPETLPPATFPPTTLPPATVAVIVTLPPPPATQSVVVAPPVVAIEPFVDAGTDPRFDTCKKAKAAGYGPYVQGQDPEYDWYRDADNDGIVCE